MASFHCSYRDAYRWLQVLWYGGGAKMKSVIMVAARRDGWHA